MMKTGNILSSFRNSFLKIDLFKLPLSFTVQNQTRISSLSGSLISFIILLLLLLFLIVELTAVFGKQNPILVRQDLQFKKRPYLAFNDRNFTFGLCLSDMFGRTFINDSVFKFESTISVVKKIKLEDGSQTFDVSGSKVLELARCNYSNFEHLSNIDDVFEVNHLGNCLCPVNSPTIDLFGYWDEGYVSYLRNTLNKCQNSTDQQNCQPKETIDEYFSPYNPKYFNFITEKQIFSVDNYENPVQSIFNTDFFQIDLNFFKTLNTFLGHAEIHDDDDILLTNDKITNFMTYGDKIRDIQLNQNNNPTLVDYSVYSNNEYVKIQRIYPKIQDAFAKIGGISKVLIIFGGILLYFNHKNILKQMILNQVYESPETNTREKTRKTELIFKKIRNRKSKKTSLKKPKSPKLKVKSKSKDSIVYESPPINKTEIQNNILSPKTLFESPKPFETNPNQIVSPKLPVLIGDTISIQNEKNEMEPNIKNKEPKQKSEVFEIELMKMSQMEKSGSFDPKIYEEKKKKKIESLELTWKEWIQKTIVKNKRLPENIRRKLKISKLSQQKFNEQLDLIRVLKKMQEIDTIKYLILDENQRALFELISKPLLYVEENEINSPTGRYSRMVSTVDGSRKNENEIDKIIEDMLEKEDMTEIDEKLLELLEMNHKQIREVYEG